MILTIIPALFLSSCALFQSGNGINPALKQAFGDAVRSLEAAGVANIPSAIRYLRTKWLPPGQIYTDLSESLIKAFLAAAPKTTAEINKVLEAQATQLQTTP